MRTHTHTKFVLIIILMIGNNSMATNVPKPQGDVTSFGSFNDSSFIDMPKSLNQPFPQPAGDEGIEDEEEEEDEAINSQASQASTAAGSAKPNPRIENHAQPVQPKGIESFASVTDSGTTELDYRTKYRLTKDTIPIVTSLADRLYSKYSDLQSIFKAKRSVFSNISGQVQALLGTQNKENKLESNYLSLAILESIYPLICWITITEEQVNNKPNFDFIGLKQKTDTDFPQFAQNTIKLLASDQPETLYSLKGLHTVNTLTVLSAVAQIELDYSKHQLYKIILDMLEGNTNDGYETIINRIIKDNGLVAGSSPVQYLLKSSPIYKNLPGVFKRVLIIHLINRDLDRSSNKFGMLIQMLGEFNLAQDLDAKFRQGSNYESIANAIFVINEYWRLYEFKYSRWQRFLNIFSTDKSTKGEFFQIIDKFMRTAYSYGYIKMLNKDLVKAWKKESGGLIFRVQKRIEKISSLNSNIIQSSDPLLEGAQYFVWNLVPSDLDKVDSMTRFQESVKIFDACQITNPVQAWIADQITAGLNLLVEVFNRLSR